ncbi:MAG: FecR domain-containing protein [Pseudomonadota bacterium]
MTTNSEKPNVIQQAAQWMSRLAADGNPSWDDPELAAWLRESPGHREAFAEVSAIWFAADQLEASDLGDELEQSSRLDPMPAAESGRATPTARRNRRWPLLAAGMMALVVALIVPAIPKQWAGMQADFATQAGQVQSVALEDGSSVQLAGDSAVSLRPGGRGLVLHYGEIFLDVEHNAAEPFVVETSEAKVTVLGTQFGVSWRDRIHRAGVVEGRVAVQHGQLPVVELSRGQFARDGQRVADPGLVQRYFGWSSGNLVFDDLPLSEVLARLAPFLDRPVVKLPGAGDPSVSAVIAVDSGPQALETLASRAGLRLVSAGPVTLLY